MSSEIPACTVSRGEVLLATQGRVTAKVYKHLLFNDQIKRTGTKNACFKQAYVELTIYKLILKEVTKENTEPGCRRQTVAKVRQC
jgi:hypothetical protein